MQTPPNDFIVARPLCPAMSRTRELAAAVLNAMTQDRPTPWARIKYPQRMPQVLTSRHSIVKGSNTRRSAHPAGQVHWSRHEGVRQGLSSGGSAHRVYDETSRARGAMELGSGYILSRRESQEHHLLPNDSDIPRAARRAWSAPRTHGYRHQRSSAPRAVRSGTVPHHKIEPLATDFAVCMAPCMSRRLADII